MPDSLRIFLGLVIGVATFSLMLGSVYVGGGTAAIRRQWIKFGLLAVALVLVIFVAVPALDALPDGIGTIAIGGVTIWALVVSRRRQKAESPAATERRRDALQKPAFRGLLVAYVVVIVATSVLVTIVALGSH